MSKSSDKQGPPCRLQTPDLHKQHWQLSDLWKEQVLLTAQGAKRVRLPVTRGGIQGPSPRKCNMFTHSVSSSCLCVGSSQPQHGSGNWFRAFGFETRSLGFSHLKFQPLRNISIKIYRRRDAARRTIYQAGSQRCNQRWKSNLWHCRFMDSSQALKAR